MEFITVSNPSRRLPAKLRRQAHSHASRATHARARRLRTEAYQRQNKIPREESQTEKSRTTKEEQDQENVNRPRRHHELILADPSETSLPAPSALGSLVHEPLASFLQSLAPREHLLFNHYVNVVAPDMQARCSMLNYLGRAHRYMVQNWVLLSTTDPEFLRWSLLAACRYLTMGRLGDEYADLAAQYKLRQIQSLRRAITNASMSREAVGGAVALAFDEVMVGNMAMAASHLLGAAHIIEAAGGFETIGVNDLVRSMMHSCMWTKQLADWNPALLAHGSAFVEPELKWT